MVTDARKVEMADTVSFEIMTEKAKLAVSGMYGNAWPLGIATKDCDIYATLRASKRNGKLAIKTIATCLCLEAVICSDFLLEEVLQLICFMETKEIKDLKDEKEKEASASASASASVAGDSSDSECGVMTVDKIKAMVGSSEWPGLNDPNSTDCSFVPIKKQKATLDFMVDNCLKLSLYDYKCFVLNLLTIEPKFRLENDIAARLKFLLYLYCELKNAELYDSVMGVFDCEGISMIETYHIRNFILYLK